MENKITVCIQTLGCRVNMYESCAISERLSENGCIIKKDDNCDYYIVNTCAVTAESERKSRQLVRRCAAKGKVLVIGCAAQIDDSFADIENVIYVGGNRSKSDVVDVICKSKEKPLRSVMTMEKAPYEKMFLTGKGELFSECRAFIKIQDGCNGKCTYCIIPKCRGSVRSREVCDIIDEARRIVQSGYSEIILTGIEVGAYNKILLEDLITEVAKINGIKRLRLGSLSPNIINERFLEKVSRIKSFMPHLHLSLQSCSDRILSAMRRPYRKADICERIDLIRKYIPNCMISADIIVGFPNEMEEDFLETVHTLREMKIFHVHSFPYSERNGTPAALMSGKIPKNIRNERNVRLINECNETKTEILDALIGKTLSVLIEKVSDGKAHGHTEEFLEATLPSYDLRVGDITEIKIVSHDGALLLGDVVKRRKFDEGQC